MLYNCLVLRGGPSSLHSTSLLSGEAVLDNLDDKKYNPQDIYIDKNSVWHKKGLPIKEFKALESADIVFNALHGEYGADGQAQTILEQAGVKFTGSESFACALSFNKSLAVKKILEDKPKYIKRQGQHFIKSTDFLDSSVSEIVDKVFTSFAPPYIVKPATQSVKFSPVVANNKFELENLLVKMALEYDEVVVEEFLFGRELSVFAIEDFRSQKLYISPIIEVLHRKKREFLNKDSVEFQAEEHVRAPAPISDDIKDKLEYISKRIFKILEFRHYARIDFILSREKDIYFLRANPLPALHYSGLLAQTLKAVGADLDVFVNHIATLALEKK